MTVLKILTITWRDSAVCFLNSVTSNTFLPARAASPVQDEMGLGQQTLELRFSGEYGQAGAAHLEENQLPTTPTQQKTLSANPNLSSTNPPVRVLFPRSFPSPPLISPSHRLLLGFCCVLVKSQLATVSRSRAPLTMASGIMLNTAPLLLSPSTGISDALWSTQEGDGGLSMKMSLRLHKLVSRTPSLSALPLHVPLSHFLKNVFLTVF